MSSGEHRQQLEQLATDVGNTADSYSEREKDTDNIAGILDKSLVEPGGLLDAIAALGKVIQSSGQILIQLETANARTSELVDSHSTKHSEVGDLTARATQATQGTHNTAAEAVVHQLQAAGEDGNSALESSGDASDSIIEALESIGSAISKLEGAMSLFAGVDGKIMDARSSLGTSKQHDGEAIGHLTAAKDSLETYAAGL
jgi:hypothetical protein